MLSPALAYIDPTGGLPPSTWGMFLAMVLGAVGLALVFLRRFAHTLVDSIRRRQQLVVLFAIASAGLVMFAWLSQKSRQTFSGGPKILILAFDGLDPQLLDKYMAEGRLPNFSRLAGDGIYHPLQTTNPPQSPVAWSSFITGKDPAEHGVMDFITRIPKTYQLDLALADRRTLRLPWKGEPFWEHEGIQRLGFSAQRLPMSFPPPKVNGKLLAGMGVWDARGTEGTYFFYSTRPTQEKELRGMTFELRRNSGLLRGDIPGPYFFGQTDDLREPFELAPDSTRATLRIQGRDFSLDADQWSDWIPIEFHIGPLKLEKAKVITRVIWSNRDGQDTLYVSPLNFDPARPKFSISYPSGYAGALAAAIGPYHTRGMPFDSHALSDGVISEDAFLAQCKMITGESEKMLFHELPHFKQGILFAYFEEPDMIQHMYWRTIDPEHPLFSSADAARHRDVIPQLYERFDTLLGKARTALGDSGTLVVLSDHGCGPFRRSVHLNAVLRDLGWLALKGESKTSEQFFKNVDWSRTRAYAVGFNSIYVNLAGREGHGCVTKAQAPELIERLAADLEKYRDPDTGQAPIRKMYPVEYTAGRDLPDLIVGYARGYRGSWAALGEVPEKQVEANIKKWSGDHCSDPHDVPGIFLSTDAALDAPSLTAVAPALIRFVQTRSAHK